MAVAVGTAAPEGAFAAFLALQKDERKKILARTHALYGDKAVAWQVLLDAYEGIGGFETGEYLWRYRLEEDSEYRARQEQARYHNYAKSLINLYVRHVFHKVIDRQTTNEELKAWWNNVDGAGTTITDLMKRAAQLGLAMGHDGILVDKTADEPVGPSKADERSRVVAGIYTPLCIKDWRLQRDEIVSLKLVEHVDRDDLLAKEEGEKHCQYLLWSKTDGFIRVDEEGTPMASPGQPAANNPNLGLVPFAVLRPEPSAANPFLGQSLLGNANIFKALFNRCSEEDEVIRASSFSCLTVSVPQDGDVATVKQELGNAVGTTRALIAKGEIDYITPNQEVPKALREAILFLVTEIYRLAHVATQRESRDAESAEAIRLKHTELNEMLAGLANACARVEEQIARFWFAWTAPTAEAAQTAYDAAKIAIRYDREFFLGELLQELEEWAEAIALDLGLTMQQRIKLKAVKRIDPDIDDATLKIVEEEIKKQPPPPPPPDPNVLRGRAGQVLNPPQPGAGGVAA